MSTVLDSIVEGVREDLSQRMRATPQARIEQLALEAPAVRPHNMTTRRFSIIAEVKRSSPSKGHLAPINDPADLGRRYERGGASVISVLTEQRRFGGTLADLVSVRESVSLPILRKDFIVTDYQVHESRAHGADVVLLIAASLDDAQLVDLYQTARELGMEVLIEVHDEAELERAIKVQPNLLGVNARNLKTLDVDLGVCDRLLPLIPSSVVGVAESGIASTQDVQRVAQAGARAILVGEALVRAGDPEGTIRDWLETAR